MAFYRILLRQSYRGREIQNVFHLEDDTNLITQELIANRIVSNWIPRIRVVQSNQLIYFQVHVTRILIPLPPATFVLDINIIGDVTGTQAVGFESYKLRFLTPLLGSRHRGGYFVGGLSQGMISQNAEGMSAPAISLFGTMILQLSDDWAEPNPNQFLNLCVAHKNDDTPTRVSSIGFTQALTYLRSRKLGRGI